MNAHVERSQEEIADLENRAMEGFESGSSYAQGVADALQWLQSRDFNDPLLD